MLEDRDYMRDQSGGIRWSMTAIIAVILVLVFALQSINTAYLHTDAEYWLALTPDCFLRGYVWQLFTFQFLHAGLLHLGGNLLVFWWVGRFVEHVLGKQRFLVALFGCGAIGGALQALLMVIAPGRFGSMVVGASAGVSGLFAIFALLERNSTVRLWFILPIRAITLLWVLGIISLFFTLVPVQGESVAHAAHLGGMLAGIGWVKLGWHQDYVRLPWEGLFARWQQWRPFRARKRQRELVKTASIKGGKWTTRSDSDADLPSEEFISREVDPILDKISQHGIQSLTDRERRILELARNKMKK